MERQREQMIQNIKDKRLHEKTEGKDYMERQ